VYQSVGDKLDVLRKIVAKHGNNAEQIAAIGDDLPDIGMLMASGLAVAVADAPNELRKRADYITRRPGGRGAVREVIDLLLKAQGRWDECVRNFETPIAGHLSGIQG
jgi:YrbI family 3-deoxy-D-manno-octulosonate 8-phosphate phosphatase